jgi:hypothetical protein
VVAKVATTWSTIRLLSKIPKTPQDLSIATTLNWLDGNILKSFFCTFSLFTACHLRDCAKYRHFLCKPKPFLAKFSYDGHFGSKRTLSTLFLFSQLNFIRSTQSSPELKGRDNIPIL